MWVKGFDQHEIGPTEDNFCKQSTLQDVYNKSILQTELSLPPFSLSDFMTVSSVQEQCSMGNKVMPGAKIGTLVLTRAVALRIWITLYLIRIMYLMPKSDQRSSASETVVTVGEGF